MKNYYDELEISKTASKEVIEKVYKVLAKKYHPDTNQDEDKLAAEEKFKKISEAYETLSNEDKRKKYDIELEQSSPLITYEEYLDVVNKNKLLSQKLNNIIKEYTEFKNSNNTSNTEYYQQQNYRNNTQIHPNHNFNNQNYQRPNPHANQSQTQNPNVSSSKSQKQTYYYTNTGKPASAFDYFIYKIKKFFSNIALLFLFIIVIILMINAFINSNLINIF